MSNEIKSKERKVFLDHLPKWEEGTNKGKINWKKCIGYEVDFIYEGLSGKVSIVRYNNPKNITIAHNGYECDITPNVFSKGGLGGVLKIITSEFKVETGELFKDSKRNLTITDRFYKKNKSNQNQKWYKYFCNVCGWKNGEVVEHSLVEQNCGCSCCSGRTAVLGINTIWDTDRWMCDLGVGEDDAKKYTYQSSNMVATTCPYCTNKDKKKISDIYKYKSIGCSCSDSKKYPSKFIVGLLNQIGVDYTTEYGGVWSNNKRYDFYITSNNSIIEAHGAQHPGTKYHNEIGFGAFKGVAKTSQQELENDIYKEQLAKENGIENYIVIDCSKSDIEFIKNEVLNSKLAELYDLSNIDWLECERFALSNRVKEVCEYWNNKDANESIVDLSVKFSCDRHTISKYLSKGDILGWCKYNAKEEIIKGREKAKSTLSIGVEVFKNGVFICKFSSCRNLSANSYIKLGVKLSTNSITKVYKGIMQEYKGFTFRFID